MTNHLAEQIRTDGRKEDEYNGSDDDLNTGTDSPATEATAPILQSEDDELFDEDALE